MLPGLSGIGMILLVGWISTSDAHSEGRASNMAVDALFPEEKNAEPASQIDDLDEEFSSMEKSLGSVEARLKQVEERLGPMKRQPTLSTSFERRLEDVERRLTKIERQLARLQNIEKRVRKLERQSN